MREVDELYAASRLARYAGRVKGLIQDKNRHQRQADLYHEQARNIAGNDQAAKVARAELIKKAAQENARYAKKAWRLAVLELREMDALLTEARGDRPTRRPAPEDTDQAYPT